MSSKPKYLSSEVNMAELSEATFFIWDTKDGRVAVETTKPASGVAWPLQVLRVVGPNQVPPPESPMTADEFKAWQQALDAAGFNLDVRFK